MTVQLLEEIGSSGGWQQDFGLLKHSFLEGLAVPFDRGEVHAQFTEGQSEWSTRELIGVVLRGPVYPTVDAWAEATKPNLPWAEEHFQERVGGQPLNPPPSHERWPHARASNAEHVDESGKFSHTYPERLWPKMAGVHPDDGWRVHRGVRYPFGDLDDAVRLLVRNPMSRQCVVPIWFPEDTGAVEGQRVPCSVGYHFMVDGEGVMDCTYWLRSCDFVRYLRDDVYMAGRLLQWMCSRVNNWHNVEFNDLSPGHLTILIDNLHVFEGDVKLMEKGII